MENNVNSAEQYWLNIIENAPKANFSDFKELTDPVGNSAELEIGLNEIKKIRDLAGNKDFNVLKMFITALTVVLRKYEPDKNILISMPPMNLPGVDLSKSGLLHCSLKYKDDDTINDLLGEVHNILNSAYLNSEYDEGKLNSLYKEKYGTDFRKNIGFTYSAINADAGSLSDCGIVFELNESQNPILKVTSKDKLPQRLLENMLESLLFIVLKLQEYKEKYIKECAIVPELHIKKLKEKYALIAKKYDLNKTVIDLFEENVNAQADKPALNYKGKNTTYKELDEDSLYVASYLTSNCIRGAVVGMMMEKSSAMVTVLLGIIRAGATCLPLDKNDPEWRVNEIIKDTGCSLVIGDEALSKQWNLECRQVNYSKDTFNGVLKEPTRPLPDDPIYIIYSSGTTGKPKGVVLQHEAFTNLLLWYNEKYTITSDTRIIQYTNVIIDIAFQEIFSALINGLTLFIPTIEESRDKDQFINYLEKNRINFIQLIPDVLSEYFLEIPKLPDLNVILCGGDRLSDSLKDKILSKGYTLYNVYGQTETAIDTVGALCEQNKTSVFNDFVPNYDLWILDEHKNICPEYVAGEIFTGGVGLAKGYINRDELTKEKFCSHPFFPGKRIYRTGDYARRLAEGSIQLLGRRDNQFKVHGFRIELEEIEKHLEEHPKVKAARVVVRMEQEEKNIEAYIITSHKEVNASELRNFLGQKIPLVMIPKRFIKTEKFPLTTTGKVNKKALLETNGSQLSGNTVYLQPKNEVEEQLLKIWKDILDVEDIGVNDNFFELGGNSLKIIRMVQKVNKIAGKKVTVVTAFTYPTISDLAEYILKNDSKQSSVQETDDIQVMNKTLNILKKN